MSFNKRYITKDTVLSCIKEGGSLSRLVNADALIMDNWSTRFFDNYDFKYYQNLRDELDNDVKFLSNLDASIRHKNYSKLIVLDCLSNILENLIKNPSWTEILIASTFNLGEVPEEFRGKFEKQKQFYIDNIVKYYTTEAREKSISNIFNNGH